MKEFQNKENIFNSEIFELKSVLSEQNDLYWKKKEKFETTMKKIKTKEEKFDYLKQEIEYIRESIIKNEEIIKNISNPINNSAISGLTVIHKSLIGKLDKINWNLLNVNFTFNN